MLAQELSFSVNQSHNFIKIRQFYARALCALFVVYKSKIKINRGGRNVHS